MKDTRFPESETLKAGRAIMEYATLYGPGPLPPREFEEILRLAARIATTNDWLSLKDAALMVLQALHPRRPEPSGIVGDYFAPLRP